METISKGLVNKMMQLNLLADDEQPMFEYSLEIILEQIICYGTVLILSVFLKNTLQILFHIIFFSALRKHTGGFHLSSFGKCYVSSVSIYLIYSIVIYPFMYNHIIINWILLIPSVIFIFVVGAINNENIHWSNKEWKETVRISRAIVLLESVVIIALYLVRIDISYVLYMSYGTILCSLLLFINYLQRRNQNHEKSGRTGCESNGENCAQGN